MLLTLILLLILVDIGLRLMIFGLDLAFLVGGRVSALTEAGVMTAARAAKRGKSKKTKFLINSAIVTGKAGSTVVKGALKTGKKVVKTTTKVILKLLQKCVTLLWKVLIAAESLIIILDIIVFFILVAVCGFYITFMANGGGSVPL